MSTEPLYINIDHLRDMKTKNDQCNLSEISKCGNEHIANGGIVIIQQEFSNDNPSEVIKLDNANDFKVWIDNFCKVIK